MRRYVGRLWDDLQLYTAQYVSGAFWYGTLPWLPRSHRKWTLVLRYSQCVNVYELSRTDTRNCWMYNECIHSYSMGSGAVCSCSVWQTVNCVRTTRPPTVRWVFLCHHLLVDHTAVTAVGEDHCFNFTVSNCNRDPQLRQFSSSVQLKAACTGH